MVLVEEIMGGLTMAYPSDDYRLHAERGFPEPSYPERDLLDPAYPEPTRNTNIIGIVAGVLILFGLLAWWGGMFTATEQAASQRPVSTAQTQSVPGSQ
jgi:hypothetical protein